MSVRDGILPEAVQARLFAAANKPREKRNKAIDDVYTWARLNYPECFTDSGQPEVPTSEKEIDDENDNQ